MRRINYITDTTHNSVRLRRILTTRILNCVTVKFLKGELSRILNRSKAATLVRDEE